MSESRFLNPFLTHSAETAKSIWHYFDQYKTSGEGKAVERPNIESFTHVSETSKLRDSVLLQKKMSRGGLSQQFIDGPDAFAFENFLTTVAMKHQWFGGEMSPTTDYDDWISGADAYVEWLDDDQKPIRMAIDFTSTKHFRVFMKKSEKIEANCQIKYLRSRIEYEHDKPKELRASMPIVVLGAEEDTFKLVAKEDKPITESHPLRRLLVEQAYSQIHLQMELLHELQQDEKSKTADTQSKTAAKRQQRYEDLQAIRSQLQKVLRLTQDIALESEWKNVAESSITQRTLST
ncbi:MAG: hypothetical protein KC585_02670 [Candidatus Magasanikbacteria bacterium]|nr:hypothetical protein [Candidatus Magasanikbacteria bacterium]